MSKLLLGDHVIWENPPDLGHFGIKLRKQIREHEICDRIDLRRARAFLDGYHFVAGSQR